MTKIIELRPNRDLMNTCFEKYQFSTDAIPITVEISLKQDVYRLELNSNQESLLEAKLFAFHNHLFKNPYDESCWFIDQKWVVWKFQEDTSLKQIHLLHDSNENISNLLYNPSMGFTKNDMVVISNGGDRLTLLVKGKQQEIKIFTLNDADSGVILDVEYVEAMSKLIIAMCAIHCNDGKKFTKISILSYIWKSTQNDTESFELISKESMKVQGAIEYIRIEDTGEYLHSISQDSIMFENLKLQSSTNETLNTEKTPAIQIPKYYWSQDEDSITVWIKVRNEHKNKAKVHVTSTELSVIVNGDILLQGKCQHRLDENLATWKYEHDAFRLDLVKFETGLMWNELIISDSDGEYLPNDTLSAEIHSRLAHLCTDQMDSKQHGQPCVGFNAEQLEECDLEGIHSFLQRINFVTQENTHLAMLGTNNHVLFTYKTKFGQAVCLRHDNDGCVWLTDRVNNTEWNIKHTSTFPGFGYVQAGKSNKKFCVSPVGNSYVAILEHIRHIFLYKKPESDIQISKQWIVDLGHESCPIMGAAATNEHLIVLTKNKLYCLQIYS